MVFAAQLTAMGDQLHAPEQLRRPLIRPAASVLSLTLDQSTEDLEPRDVWSGRPERAQGSNSSAPPHKLRIALFDGNAPVGLRTGRKVITPDPGRGDRREMDHPIEQVHQACIPGRRLPPHIDRTRLIVWKRSVDKVEARLFD